MNSIEATREMIEDLPASELQHVLLILIEVIAEQQEQINELKLEQAEQGMV